MDYVSIRVSGRTFFILYHGENDSVLIKLVNMGDFEGPHVQEICVRNWLLK